MRISTILKKLTVTIALTVLAGCSSENSPAPANGDYFEDFTGTNGANWPVEWMPVAASTVNADIQNNSGRLQAGTSAVVARVVSTTLSMTNFDAKFIIRFEDFPNQGIGFYGRQNGGYLVSTTPNGQGYGLFTEGDATFDPSDIGIWEEINGVEAKIMGVPPGSLLNNTNYCIRYRVEQLDATQTQLRARIWLQTDAEPSTWNVELISTTTQLQNRAGGFAVDLYNYNGTSAIYFDSIEITNLDL